MALNAFDLRVMISVLAQRKPTMTHYRNTWFRGPPQIHPSENFDIDVRVGGIRIAPFVSPIREGKVMRAEGFTTYSVKPGYIKPKRTITAADLQKRLPGEDIFSSRSIQEREQLVLARDLGELDDACVNREEVMMRDALLNGKIEIYEDIVGTLTKVREVDFLRNAALTIALTGSYWSTSSTTILSQLQTWANLLRTHGSLGPDVLILAPDLAADFVANTTILALLNLLNVNVGNIAPREIVPGIDYIGRLNAPGCYVEVWCDSRTYTNEAGASTPMMPAKTLLLGSTKAQCELHYGPIQDLEAAADLGIAGGGMIPAQRFPKTWTEKDPSVRHVLLQSAPLPVPVNVNGFLKATVKA
jgi:hypothetical protein